MNSKNTIYLQRLMAVPEEGEFNQNRSDKLYFIMNF